MISYILLCRRSRIAVAGAVLACAIVLLGVPAAAFAATNTTTPKSGTWGAWKACAGSSSAANCASVYAAGENPKTSTLFVGGNFTAAENSATGARVGYQNLMAVNADTGALETSFARHTFNGPILAMAVDVLRDRLFVGGNFTTIDGSRTAARHVAAFSMSTGAHLIGFDPRPDGPVRALVYSGITDLIYFGGHFNTVSGKPRNRIAAANPVGGGLSSKFVPPTLAWTESGSAADVESLAVGTNQNGAPFLYVGGHFDRVGGHAQLCLTRLRLSTGAFDGGFRPTLDHYYADDLLAIDKIVYRGGSIIVGQAGHTNRAYRFSLTGSRVWRLQTDGDVQTLAVHGPTVYVGGHFRCMDRNVEPTCASPTTGWTRIHLAALNRYTGAVDPGFGPRLEPTVAPDYFGVWMLHVSADGTLWVGGVSTKVVSGGHTYNRPKLAAFSSR